MTIIKSFAQDGTALGERMDQLVEVLRQLLDEHPDTTLPSDSARVIHVVEETCE